jgi:CBS domain-containing protein
MTIATSVGRIIDRRAGPVITCTPDDRVREAARLLAANRIGCLPVLAPGAPSGAVLGIFSERDLLYCIDREGGAVLERPVGEVMTTPAITIDIGADVLAALALMTRRRVRHLPVMDGGRLAGFVSIGDLVKHRIDAIESEAEAMRAYIAQ